MMLYRKPITKSRESRVVSKNDLAVWGYYLIFSESLLSAGSLEITVVEKRFRPNPSNTKPIQNNWNVQPEDATAEDRIPNYSYKKSLCAVEML
jgi:hypothetical protein